MINRVNIARLSLGLIFLILGMNGFFHFLPVPFFMEPAKNFLNALSAVGYLFPFVSVLESLCGLFLLMDIYVPLALMVLAPILVNILLFHLYLSPGLVYFPLLVTLLYIYLAFVAKPYSQVIRQLFQQPVSESVIRAPKKKIRESVG